MSLNDDLESRIAEAVDGTPDVAGREALAQELDRSPEARSAYADQLQVHHLLGVALERPAEEFRESVLREIRLLSDGERFSRGVVTEIKRASRGRLRFWELAAAGLLLGFLAWLTVRPQSGPLPARLPDLPALLVVGNEPLEAGDAAVEAHLKSLGLRVTTKSAHEVQLADLPGQALVLLSSTAPAKDVLMEPGGLMSKFRTAAVPVIVWEPRLFYDLGMTPGSASHQDWGTVKNQLRLSITSPGHPLAAGLSGSATVTSAPAQYSWGRVRADAVVIAAIEGEPARAAVFAYEAGAAMPGLAAPARRVGFFLFDRTSLDLTPAGWDLFDAAVRWSVRP